MSDNRIISHRAAGYVEVAFKGHEDWMSAVHVIEQISVLIDELGVFRILLDFTRVDMRLAVVEAPAVAKLFDVFSDGPMNLGIIRSGEDRGDATIEAFAASMIALGHRIDYLESCDRIEAWLCTPRNLSRRAS